MTRKTSLKSKKVEILILSDYNAIELEITKYKSIYYLDS